VKKLKPDVAELIIKMQQQLTVLEKKIDALGGQHGGGGGAKQDRDRRERILYKAICADCNKECEVPFRPSQDRPVYCKGCFSSRKGGGSFHTNRDITPPHPFEKFQKKAARKAAKGKNKRRQ